MRFLSCISDSIHGASLARAKLQGTSLGTQPISLVQVCGEQAGLM
jgi:hypothetical protein